MFSTIKILRSLSYQTRTTSKFLNYGNVIQNSYRNIQCNSKLCRKMFFEHENRYAYDVMRNKGYVADLLLLAATKNDTAFSKEQFDKTLQEDWSKKPLKELIETFSLLGSYSSRNGLCISNKIFDSFIDALTDHINQASDQELRLLFYYLLKWPETDSIRTRNFIEIWAALDDECLNRIRGWSFDEMLSFVALFYMLNVTRASDFSTKCIQKMASKAKQLTSSQLVQTMFFIGIIRRPPFDMHNMELQLDALLPEFTIDELAIASMGFFKSKTPIRSMELISKIITEVIKSSKDIHEVSLAALLKVVRYSVKIASDDTIYQLLDTLQYEVPRLSLMCNVHLALLGTGTLTLHEKCLTNIASFATDNLAEARLKDLERLALTYGIFNLISNTTECFFQKIVDELRNPERSAEIEKHGRSFACCVAYLGHLGIYPIDLMDKVLSPEFLQSTYGKQVMAYGREVLVVHNSSQIFFPDANMHRLSDKYAVLLAKKYTDFVPNENFVKQYNVAEKMVLDVIKLLKEIQGGEEYVIGDHIVTHHQRGDLIICNDPNGTPMKVMEYFNTSRFGVLRKAPNDNIWVAFVIAGRNAIIRNSDSATGPFQTKIRELEALGFHTALVPWSKYSLLDTKEAKIGYLKGLMNEAISNKSKYKITAPNQK